ncbi:hypothetical protein C723_1483 [Christiangramia flava JLT2011]|nr:hypothetical protein C723_1483 [Christiangramia flava JLT2011]|tara:strand:- start:420 stop:581 length:162 start_codon:yes stop_codon:yes gene_type:complete
MPEFLLKISASPVREQQAADILLAYNKTQYYLQIVLSSGEWIMDVDPESIAKA